VNVTLERKLFLATIKQYCVDFLVEKGWATGGIEVHEQFLVETAMRAIYISFKVPALKLQSDREVARYPATLWSHILHVIGLGKYATYRRVLLNECLTFPTIEIPPEMKVGMRLCYDYRTVDR